jgi:cation transport protein ChaC
MSPGPHDKAQLELPLGEDFWVFGYGSLMWDPGFPHLEVRLGMLYGFHRHLCIYSHIYRGTPERPGLVFGLDRGGSCRGLVYRVPAAEGEAVIDYLMEREMVTKVYRPRWVKVHTQEGPVTAATFTVDGGHKQYAGRLSDAELVEHILQGRGSSGSALEYLEKTVHHMDALGIGDPPLKRLLRLVHARLGG